MSINIYVASVRRLPTCDSATFLDHSTSSSVHFCESLSGVAMRRRQCRTRQHAWRPTARFSFLLTVAAKCRPSIYSQGLRCVRQLWRGLYRSGQVTWRSCNYSVIAQWAYITHPPARPPVRPQLSTIQSTVVVRWNIERCARLLRKTRAFWSVPVLPRDNAAHRSELAPEVGQHAVRRPHKT